MLFSLSYISARANAYLGIQTPMGLTNHIFFFLIEIKVTEWISFEKKENVAFSYTLKMHSKGSQQSMGPITSLLPTGSCNLFG